MQRDAMLRQSALTDPQTPADQLSAASRAGWDVVQPGEPLILRRGDRERVMPLTLLAGWVARGCPDREPVDALAVLYALPGTVTELRRRLAGDYDTRGLTAVLRALIEDGAVEAAGGVYREPEPEL